MAQPGLGRATLMGILGFLTGSLLVTVIRALQSMDPIWDSGVGIIFSMFLSAAFFVWGIGAFNFKLSAHGEGPEIEKIHAELQEKAKEPSYILTSTVWQIGGLLLGMILLIFAAAVLGPSLTISGDPNSSTKMVGFFELTIAGETLYLSQFVIFLLFVGFVLLSLGLIAGGLAMLVFNYDRGLKVAQLEAKAAAAGPALGSGNAAVAALPSGAGDALVAAPPAAPAAPRQPRNIPLPPRFAFWLVIAALIYFVHFPALALFGLNTALADIWPLLSLLFIGAGVLLFIEIIPAEERPFDAVLKYAITALAAYVVISLGASWFRDVSNMYIDPFFAGVIEIIGQVAALTAPAMIFRADSRMKTLAKYCATAAVLYAVFWYAAIGLILPTEPTKTVLTIANVVLITALLYRLNWLLGLLGIFAGLMVRLLRWIPKFLFQKG